MRPRHSTLTDVLVAGLEPPASWGPGVPGVALELLEAPDASCPEVAAAFRGGLTGAFLLAFGAVAALPFRLPGRSSLGSAAIGAVDGWTPQSR
jgi:hypothetical protein